MKTRSGMGAERFLAAWAGGSVRLSGRQGRQCRGLLIAVLCCTTGLGQDGISDSVFHGTTPPGVEAGAAAGSYALGGFDNVNLFNGQLSLALPLLRIGGRGEAGYTITARIEQQWTVTTNACDECSPQPLPQLLAEYTNTGDLGDLENYRYEPGVMYGRTGLAFATSVSQQPGCEAGQPVTHKVLTRFTFAFADGRTIELRDIQREGEADTNPMPGICNPAPGSVRGRTFYAGDGSGAMYVLDQPFQEFTGWVVKRQESHVTLLGPNGILMFPDGTVYRIEGGGVVKWIRDRNGNRVEFHRAPVGPVQKLVKITDSLRRETVICYALLPCQSSNPEGYDRIRFPGANGQQRELRIYFASLGSVLFGGGLKNIVDSTLEQGLFVGSDTTPPLINEPQVFNPDRMIDKIQLPNAQTYEFRYNSYGELARVILPTGGMVDYTYAGLPGTKPSGLWTQNDRTTAFRAVQTRTESTADQVVSGKAQFQYAFLPSGACFGFAGCTVATVKSYTGNGAQFLGEERHYFHGQPFDALLMEAWTYPDWRTGREYRTESYDKFSQPLRAVQREWEQRAAVPWWTGAAAEAPPNQPRTRQVDTVAVAGAVGRLARKTFWYGPHRVNNVADVEETDYGASGAWNGTLSPGAVLRRTHLDYRTDLAYTANDFLSTSQPWTHAISYLPSLVTAEWVCGTGAGWCTEGLATVRTRTYYDQETPQNLGRWPGTTARPSLAGDWSGRWEVRAGTGRRETDGSRAGPGPWSSGSTTRRAACGRCTIRGTTRPRSATATTAWEERRRATCSRSRRRSRTRRTTPCS
ncbi:MAG: hypothetical protein IPM24_12895 [Bryobacterales bacterium]|nr:hypothetical protein [Bryobacterales bacterium]